MTCTPAGDGADRHDQRVDHDVARGNAVIGGAMHDLLRDLEAYVGILRDTGLVVEIATTAAPYFFTSGSTDSSRSSSPVTELTSGLPL